MAAFIQHVRLSKDIFRKHNVLRVWATCDGLPKSQTRISTRSFSRLHNGIQTSTTSLTKRKPCVWNMHDQPKYLFGAATVRWNSSTVKGTPEVSEVAKQLKEHFPEGYIPEAPPIPLPDTMEMVEPALNALGEPTLSSLGLACTYTPAGLIQNALEFLHVSTGLPWWGCIAITTVCMRILVFPVMLKSIKANINLQNNMPQMTRAQEKMKEARISGNMLEMTRAAREMEQLSKKSSSGIFLAPLVQAPIFISMFVGLRKMAYLPVESLQTGGMLWFTDLTMADPTYILPIITSTTLLVTMELGSEGMSNSSISPKIRWAMRAMPLIVFPFTMNFPAAMLCYWCTSNFFSLGQTVFLKIPAVKNLFNIPDKVKHDPETFKPKSFREGWREAMANTKKIATLEERMREDAKNFQRAGMGPIVKTYAMDSKEGKERLSKRNK